MNKQKIKEMIVVEGKHDTSTLKMYFDCDTIETGGDQLSEATLERIVQAQEKEGSLSSRIRIRLASISGARSRSGSRMPNMPL